MSAERIPLVTSGTKITCPNCSAVIAVAKVDIHRGDRLSEAFFEGIQKPLHAGTAMNCGRCSEPFFFNGRLHTIGGWNR